MPVRKSKMVATRKATSPLTKAAASLNKAKKPKCLAVPKKFTADIMKEATEHMQRICTHIAAAQNVDAPDRDNESVLALCTATFIFDACIKSNNKQDVIKVLMPFSKEDFLSQDYNSTFGP